MKCIIGIIILSLSSFNEASAQYPVFGNDDKPKGKIKSFIESCYETSQKSKVLVSKNEFTYDNKGILIQRVIFNTIDSNVVDGKVTYRYQDGKLSEEIGDNYSNHFTYNSEGLVLKKIKISKDGNHLLTDAFSYNDRKRAYRQIRKAADTISKSYIALNTYDFEGHLIEQRNYALNNFIRYSSKFRYNHRGQLIEETRYNHNGSYQYKKTYNYQYDKSGNWVSLVNKNKNSSYITVRSITYY